MNYQQLITSLSVELTKPLPGKPVQLVMSSLQRIREIFDFHDENNARKSSVMILLYPDLDTTMFVVTQRPVYDGVHSGQISLPGGQAEPGDESPEDTARRETFEEIGVPGDKIKIIGKLTELYIPPSNYLVQPFIGYVDEKPEFFPHPKEVKEIIEIPLAELINDENRKNRNIKVRGMEIFAPCYVIRNYTIWGATAMILSEFKAIVRQIPDQE